MSVESEVHGKFSTENHEEKLRLQPNSIWTPPVSDAAARKSTNSSHIGLIQQSQQPDFYINSGPPTGPPRTTIDYSGCHFPMPPPLLSTGMNGVPYPGPIPTTHPCSFNPHNPISSLETRYGMPDVSRDFPCIPIPHNSLPPSSADMGGQLPMGFSASPPLAPPPAASNGPVNGSNVGSDDEDGDCDNLSCGKFYLHWPNEAGFLWTFHNMHKYYRIAWYFLASYLLYYCGESNGCYLWSWTISSVRCFSCDIIFGYESLLTPSYSRSACCA